MRYSIIPGWNRLIQNIRNINNSTDNLVKVSETADKTSTYVTKVIGVSTGAVGTAKGTVDMLEALACQDDISALISGVGVCADSLSLATFFIPGPNVTTIVTVSISAGYKVFVHCFKIIVSRFLIFG